MGLAYKRLGRADEALAAYRRSLALVPDDTVTLQNYAIALGELGLNTELEAALAALVRLHPTDVPLRTEYANVLMNNGAFSEAATAYEAAVRLEPQNPELLYAHGVALSALGRGADAIARWESAVAIDPQLGVAYAALAQAFAGNSDYEKAWDAVAECERLGYSLPPDFMAALRNASGRLSRSSPAQ
jgi:tetratricopeptide (TPR) repeat protein